jgi:CDP-diacylglycerol--glycerol-3-phosphate 3-phosphatidyltransferase
MLDNDKARTVVGRAINPIAGILVKLGVSPNAVTVLGTVGISGAAILFFPEGNFFVGTLVILVFIFSDLLDGTVARISGKSNPIGAFLDSTMDRVTDAALFGSLVIYYANQGSNLLVPAIVTAFAAQLISYIRAKAESQGISMKVGIAERPERIIILLVGTGFTGLGLSFAIDVAVVILTVLTIVTVLQRLIAAYQSNLS